MNKIISILAAVAVVAPVAAFADIDIDSGYPSPQNASVELGQTIEFTVRADTDGNGSDDDWKSTQWDVISDGEGPVCVNDPSITQDANNVTSTWEYTAVSVGEKTVQVKVYNQPNCNGSERDTKTTSLTVTEPVVEEPTPAEQCELDGGTWNGDSCDFPSPEEPSEPSEPSQTSFGGGGGPCDPATGFPECQQNVAWFAWNKQVLAWQDILQKLQILIWKLEEAQN
jgi:hypothetical protein